MAEAETRARLAIDARRTRDAADRARANADRARAVMRSLPGVLLERRAAAARAAHADAARRARLTPVHERLIAAARSDVLAAVPEMPESIEWSTP
jgi:hypothetical protein